MRRRLGYAGGGRTYSGLSDDQLQHYGETGPEHEFFTGSLPDPPPIKWTPTPTIPTGPSTQGAGSGVIGDVISGLGAISKLGKLTSTAGSALQGMGLDNSFTQGMVDYGNMAKNPIKTAVDWYRGLGGGAADAGSLAGGSAPLGDAAALGSLGAGSATAGGLFGTSAAGALGASAPTATTLGALDGATAGSLFGTSGSAAAGAGAGSLGGGSLAGATEAGLGGSGAGAGAGAAEGAAGASGSGAAAGSTFANVAGPAIAAYAAYFLANGLLSKPTGIALSGDEQRQWNNEVLRSKMPYIDLGNGSFLLQNGGVTDWNGIQALGQLVPGGIGATTMKHSGDEAKFNEIMGQIANPQLADKYSLVSELGTRAWDWTPEQIQAERDRLASQPPQVNESMSPEDSEYYRNLYGYADGGMIGWPLHEANREFARGGSPFSPLSAGLSDVPRYVQGGPGGGRGDLIDAKLSPKEYVMDAETVALAGDGDPDEGARKLDEFRRRLRMHKGKNLAKGKFSANAKPLHHYMGTK